MAFDASKENRKAIDRLWLILETKSRGDLVIHEVIEKALGVSRDFHKYYQLLEKIKRRMEDERGISLISIFDEGYRLALASEQLDLGTVRARRAARQIRRGVISVGCLPDEGLTIQQSRQKTAMETRLTTIEREARAHARWLSILLRPREGNPRLYQDEPPDEGLAEIG